MKKLQTTCGLSTIYCPLRCFSFFTQMLIWLFQYCTTEQQLCCLKKQKNSLTLTHIASHTVTRDLTQT